jgi:hypothetical protein
MSMRVSRCDQFATLDGEAFRDIRGKDDLALLSRRGWRVMLLERKIAGSCAMIRSRADRSSPLGRSRVPAAGQKCEDIAMRSLKRCLDAAAMHRRVEQFARYRSSTGKALPTGTSGVSEK